MNPIHNPSSEIRRANRAAVLRFLASHRGALRASISQALNLTPAGLSRIVRDLIDANLVVENVLDVALSRAGRRAGRLEINPEGAFVLGVSITANRRNVAVVNAVGTVVEQIEINDVDASDPDATLQAILQAAAALAASTNPWHTRLAGVGVSVATTEKISLNGDASVGVLGWTNVPIGRLLEDQLHLPVIVTSRADSLVQAEVTRSAEPGCGNLLINVGLGIGCAWLVADQSGSRTPELGNIAHIPAPDSDVLCTCARRGCYQVSASGIAVVRALGAYQTDVVPPLGELSAPLASATYLADSGNAVARAAFRRAGTRLAQAIDTAHALLAPDIVYLAGETGRQADFVAGVREGLDHIQSPLSPDALLVSDVRTVEAAATAALQAFVFNRDVDLERLKAA